MKVRLSRVINTEFEQPETGFDTVIYDTIITVDAWYMNDPITNSGVVNYVFPTTDIFSDKDWIIVELSFDVISWHRSEYKQVLYEEIEIQQIRPHVTYLDNPDNILFIDVGSVSNSSSGGVLLDTSLDGRLLCRFSGI